jgi:hypothetical protein
LRPVIRRAIGWKYCWAGAATPTQPSTSRPKEQSRRADDVFNGTNMLGKDKSRWPISNTLETKTVPDAIRSGCSVLIAWLIGLPRRAGRRLFASQDTEAGWRRWQVTEKFRGLGRQYRDPLFDALKTDATLRRDDITAENDTTAENAAGLDRSGCPPSGEQGLRRLS